MNLSDTDTKLFYKLQAALMHFINQQLDVNTAVSSVDDFPAQPPEARVEVRNALVDRPELIDSFLDANTQVLTDEESEILSSWRHLVAGEFYAFRQLKKHMIFLSTKPPAIAYGVVALMDPFEIVIGPRLPVLLRAVLLPFKGRIVYDGILTAYPVVFGGGVKRGLNESYRKAKSEYGIVTSLPIESATTDDDSCSKHTESGATKKGPATTKTTVVATATGRSKDVKSVLHEIVTLTDLFCQEHLDDEYAECSRKMAEKLSRKRPSPLLKGKPKTWASGIVRTVGWVNFLDDNSFEPHVNLKDIDKALGVATSTGQSKSGEIRKLFKIQRFDPDWTVPSRMDENPLVWLVEVNGFVIDIRDAPKAFQEAAYQRGVIPYLPEESSPSPQPTTKMIASDSPADKIYQFKITVIGTDPAIWRRIQVRNCSLDEFHEHIQTSLGWTNSHLHEFTIDGQSYGDPELLDDGFGDSQSVDSRTTNISEILPKSTKRFQFSYMYDFGDDWQHEVLFEGCPKADPNAEYPLCLEGERACPPEDVGGVWGFRDFLEAVTDPTHEQHEELLEWSGPFEPDAFDPKAATQEMRQGLPAWK